MTAARELAFSIQGAGPPVVLVHGTGPGLWGEVPERLVATGRSVVGYDRRGFGSAPGPRGLGVSDHADDLAQVITSAAAEGPVVVGWSWGGLVALDLARRPGLVSGLVVLEAPLHVAQGLNAGFAGLRAMGGAILLGKLGRHRKAARRFARWALGRTDGSCDLDRMTAGELTELDENAEAMIAELASGDTGKALDAQALSEIACPVRWLVGDLSQPALQRPADRAKSLLPAIQILPVTGTGHAIAQDRPDAVVDAVVSLDGGATG